MPKKPIEFTFSKPLVVSIEKNKTSGEWDIQPHSDFIQKIKDRLEEKLDPNNQKLRKNIDDEWSTRRAANAPLHPHFIEEENKGRYHTPIVMREGEVVQFVCNPAFAFEIWADRDLNVQVAPGAPNNPFGWQGPRSVAAGGSITASVITPAVDANGNPTEPGPREQRFFKFTAWVHDTTAGKMILVDPDGSCDR